MGQDAAARRRARSVAAAAAAAADQMYCKRTRSDVGTPHIVKKWKTVLKL